MFDFFLFIGIDHGLACMFNAVIKRNLHIRFISKNNFIFPVIVICFFSVAEESKRSSVSALIFLNPDDRIVVIFNDQ
jgi:hypothetical protein